MGDAVLAFSAGEYARLRRLTEDAVEARGLDALVTTVLGNICWLTGFGDKPPG